MSNNTKPTKYTSRSAQQACASGYGDKQYWDYLEEHALRIAKAYHLKGDDDKALNILNRSLSESLVDNEGN